MGSPNQQWIFEDNFIKNKLNTSMVVDIQGANRWAWAKVGLWPKHGKSNQLWDIESMAH